MQPVHVDARAEHVVVEWPDGARHEIPNGVLRAACPCATCNDIRDAGQTVVIVEGLRAHRLWLVGGYALGIAWTDTHETGLYSFALLREIGAR